MFAEVDIILVLFGIALVYGLKVYRAAETEQTYLSPDNTKALRGGMAVVIVLHHLSTNVSGGGIFQYLFRIGYLCVTAFFFLSGYGITGQYRRKGKKYLDTFLSRHVLYQIILLSIATCVYLIWYRIDGRAFSISDIALSFVNGHMIAASSWYLMPLLLYYFAFWFAFSFMQN